VEVSAEAQDLIMRLLCDKDSRLDFAGVKNHKFFGNLNWNTIFSRLLLIFNTYGVFSGYFQSDKF
jgi:hypothetical protein